MWNVRASTTSGHAALYTDSAQQYSMGVSEIPANSRRARGPRLQRAWNNNLVPDIVIGQGAVPIVIDGTVVGAVGVSGGIPADLDHAIAEAAVRAE